VLHVFERSEAPARLVPLPRVHDDCGIYLFDRGGALFARSGSGGRDPRPRVWDAVARAWKIANAKSPNRFPGGNGLLEVTERDVCYRDQRLVQWAATDGRLGRPYYAAGRLVVWNHFAPGDSRPARLLAWAWVPGQAALGTVNEATVQTLTHPEEF